MIPTAEQFDLVIIGGGPGGYSAALYAASAGVKVAMVERDALGGTCLNRGCIPAKAFLETAAVHRHVEHAAEFGIEASAPTVNFAVTQAAQATRSSPGSSAASPRCARAARSRCSTAPAGSARITSSPSPRADGSTTEITGTSVLLAAGSVPRLIPNFERGGPIMTSDEVLDLDYVPARLAVIGGGAIGCEFASTFADLGAQVTILEALPKILPGLDSDVANVVVRSFKKKKIDIRTGVMVHGHTPNDAGGTTVHFGEGEDLEVDAVVVSVGRRPFADELGLDGTGVKVDERGFVVVDEFCRTGEDGVYAVGDLINTPQLAHVGYAEAILVVKQHLGEAAAPVMYDRVPWAIYCHPEVAWAGPGEAEAKEAGYDVVVAKHPFKFNSRAKILGETEGLCKIIAEKGAGRPGRSHPRRAHGRAVGHRAAERRVPRRELGRHRRRGRRVHPAPPQPDRAVRRDGDVAHRPQLQRLRSKRGHPMADVTLPQLGETVTEGTITQWFKQVGDTVAADEALFEVSTDKVDTEVPSPVAGTLTEIRVQEGETVEVGTVIAVVGDGDGAPAAAEEAPAEEAPGRGAGARPRNRRAEEAAGRGAGEAPAAGTEPEPAAAEDAAPAAAAGSPSPAAPRRGDAVGRQGHPAVAGRAPAGQRARPRPDGDHRHRSRRAHHPRRRARPHRQDGQQAGRTGRRAGGRRSARPAAQAAPAAPAPAATPAAPPRRRSRPASATRRSSCPRSASSPAPTW